MRCWEPLTTRLDKKVRLAQHSTEQMSNGARWSPTTKQVTWGSTVMIDFPNPSFAVLGEKSPLHSPTRHTYEPECFRLRLHRTTQFTTTNKTMNGDSQKRMAATMVSH